MKQREGCTWLSGKRFAGRKEMAGLVFGKWRKTINLVILEKPLVELVGSYCLRFRF